MKLLAPVSNFASAKRQIEAGANEIYVGADYNTFENFAFHARSRYTNNMEKLCPDFYELKEMISFAHENNVRVMFAANTPLLADDPEGTNDYETQFLNYVEEGIKAGADSIVLADLGAVLLIRGKGIKTHLTASTTIETTNIEQIKFFEELGFNRIVLSYPVTLREVEELTRLSNLEVEVFGHFGCSFYDGYCNFKHPSPDGSGPFARIGLPCCNTYKVIKNGEEYKEGQYLNATQFCSVCSLIRLKMAGVHSIKIVGRDMNPEQNARITAVYAEILKFINNSNDPMSIDIEAVKEKFLPEPWLQSFCKNNSCKYIDTTVTLSFI